MHKLPRVIFVLLLICLTGCATNPEISVPNHSPPPLVMKKKPRIALVLGGGGARGYAHIGVLKVLKEAGIEYDLIVGTSVGSLIGAMYADCKDPDMIREVMFKAGFFDFADFAVYPPLKAPITGNKYQRFIMDNINANNYKDLKIPFVSTATDLETGEQVVHSSGPLAPAINASSAMPGAVRPVKLYGRLLTDGGMYAPVAVNVAKRYKPDFIIAVNVHSDLPPKMPGTFAGVLHRAFSISWYRLGVLTTDGADLVIHPELGNGGPFGIHKKKFYYQQGVKAAKAALPELRKRLAKKTSIKLARSS